MMESLLTKADWAAGGDF